MKHYTIRIIADLDIDAENIMHANHVAKRIRVVGDNRDIITHKVLRRTETRHWVRIDEDAPRPTTAPASGEPPIGRT